MALDRFTTLAQEALANAQARALRSSHAQITPLHLLATLLEARDSVAGSILDRAGLDRTRIQQVSEAELSRMPTVKGASVQTSSQLQQVLAAADRDAQAQGDQFISCEHLLQSLSETDVPKSESAMTAIPNSIGGFLAASA